MPTTQVGWFTLRIALAVALSGLPSLPHAQGIGSGTLDVYFERVTSAGKLVGCSIVFTTIATDNATQRGAQIVLNGSLLLRSTDNGILYTGKLGTRELASALAGQGQWSPPNHFHFATRNGTTATSGKVMPSETEGYKLLIGPVDKLFMALLADLAETSEFTVGFNRRIGGQDVLAPVNLSRSLKNDARGNAVQVTNLETSRDFFECTGQLAQGAIDRKR